MNIVITGGGTGGHLYPGLEIVKHYRDLNHNVYYIASKNGVDKEIIDSQKNLDKIKIMYWDLNGIDRKISLKSFIKNIHTLLKLLKLNISSKKLITNQKIDLVIGVGGYISYPIVKSASKKKVYTIIHEQNSYPGLVNKKLADVVNNIFITYESSIKYFKGNEHKIVNSSNPRVNKVMHYKNKNYKKELNLNENKKLVLFLGGSLGSQTINDLFLNFIKKNSAYQSVLISGLKNNEIDKSTDLKDNIILENTPDVLKYLASSDVVISRAGASTLMEIIYMQKPSIIIPSPNVVANHQQINAEEFYKKGLIKMILEKDLTEDKFANALKEIENNDIIIENLKSYPQINSLEKFTNILEKVNGK